MARIFWRVDVLLGENKEDKGKAYVVQFGETDVTPVPCDDPCALRSPPQPMKAARRTMIRHSIQPWTRTSTISFFRCYKLWPFPLETWMALGDNPIPGQVRCEEVAEDEETIPSEDGDRD